MSRDVIKFIEAMNMDGIKTSWKRTIHRLNYEIRTAKDIYRSIFQSTSWAELCIIIQKNFNRHSGDDEFVQQFKWSVRGGIQQHSHILKKHMRKIPLSAVDVYLSIRRVVSSDLPKIKCCVRTAWIIIIFSVSLRISMPEIFILFLFLTGKFENQFRSYHVFPPINCTIYIDAVASHTPRRHRVLLVFH